MSREEPKSRELFLERVAAGELGPEVYESLSAQDRERIDAMRAEGAELLESLSPESVAREVHRRRMARQPQSERHQLARLLYVGGGAFAAALVLLLIWHGPGIEEPSIESHPDDVLDVVRAKGDPRLFAHLQTDKGSRPLRDGDRVVAGDRIQLQYLAAGWGYGCIFSVDGRGVLSQHLPPEEASEAAVLAQESKVSLASSYELDDAPAYERFYFVASKHPFALRVVEDALRNRDAEGGPLSLPSHFHQTQLYLRKD